MLKNAYFFRKKAVKSPQRLGARAVAIPGPGGGKDPPPDKIRSLAFRIVIKKGKINLKRQSIDITYSL